MKRDFSILLSVMGLFSLLQLSYLSADTDNWWYADPEQYVCLDTYYNQNKKPEVLEKAFNMFGEGCIRQMHGNSLKLTCYGDGKQVEFYYFKTQKGCNAFISVVPRKRLD